MNAKDNWKSAESYEYFMGRWSKQLAPQFLNWLKPPQHLSWLDVGCGTGALTAAIQKFNPAYSLSIDPSSEFIEKAQSTSRTDFAIGTASAIPKPDNSFDIVVSGLALNFFPDLHAAISEMKRVLKTGGTIAAYVWDYSGQMEFLRHFWDAVAAINPDDKKFDEGIRFPICNVQNLKNVFQDEGLLNIETTFIDIPTFFKNFEDYWNPFLGGQGPAPGYLSSQSPETMDKIKLHLQNKLIPESDGTIKLIARAIAIKGTISK